MALLAFRWLKAVRDDAPEDWTAFDKAVLYTLFSFLDNRSGRTRLPHPTQEQLAAGSGTSVSTVKRVLAKAEDAGWLSRTYRRGRGQDWKVSVYQVSIPESSVLLEDSPLKERSVLQESPPPRKGEVPQSKGEFSRRAKGEFSSRATSLSSRNISGPVPGPVGSPAPARELGPEQEEFSKRFAERFKGLVSVAGEGT